VLAHWFWRFMPFH